MPGEVNQNVENAGSTWELQWSILQELEKKIVLLGLNSSNNNKKVHLCKWN